MKFKSYPEYCDPERSFLPVLPAHWHVQRNKHLLEPCKLTVGKNASNYQLLSLTLKGIITRDIETGFGKMPAEFDSYQVVEKGDIIFCLFDMDETPRTVGLSDQDGMITGAYSVFRSKPNITPEYIYYYYLHLDSFKGLRPFYTGLRKVIRSEVFASIETPVPPEEEQTQIATFLDRETAKIDRLIEKQQRLIKLLEEKRQAVISHAVTKGLNPDTPMKDSGVEWLGEVPEHWSALQLKRLIAKVQTGNTPSGVEEHHFDSEGTAWYGPSDFTESLYLTDAARKLSESGKKEARIFPPMTVMLVGIGATIGKVSLTNIESSANQQINGISCKDSLDPIFCTYYLRTIKDYIVKCGKYTTMPIINQEETKNLVVTAPPVEEQKVIVKHIQRQTLKLDTLVEKAQSAINLLKERRTALISAAVTGKIDVRGQVQQDVEEAVAS